MLRIAQLASRISALEDALILEAGDDHPLLACEDHQTGCVFEPSIPVPDSSSMDHRMDAGILVLRNETTQSFIGAQAAEVRPSLRLLVIIG